MLLPYASLRYWPMLLAYERATRSPVLTQRMALPGLLAARTSPRVFLTDHNPVVPLPSARNPKP
eukprot:1058632-Rhodomonas_salina.5